MSARRARVTSWLYHVAMDLFDRSAAPPPAFDVAFLEWFRSTTERNWAAWQARYFEGTEYAAFGSAPWQQHARWLDGLSDDAIDSLERTWSVRYPPDLRLFLRRLHAADRPPPVPSIRLVSVPPVQAPFFHYFGFYNWSLDTDALRWAFAWPLDGLYWDLEYADLWHDSWGRRYTDLDDRKKRVAELVAQAPRLIPLLGHRYLLAEPCRAGNPVLSVYQSDIVVYGGNLRDYLFAEFANFLGSPGSATVPDDAEASWRTIPFWGEFL